MPVCSCTRSASETKVALVEPTSRMRSGLSASTRFQVGGIAAPGDAADLRPCADVRQHIGALFRPVGARPADQQVGRQRIEQDRGRRSGRENARDLFRDRQRAAGRIGDRCRTRTGAAQAARPCRQKGSAADCHVNRGPGPARRSIDADHDARCLDHGIGRLAFCQLQFVRRLIGDRSCDASVRRYRSGYGRVVAPFLTSTILPLSWLRALSFMICPPLLI